MICRRFNAFRSDSLEPLGLPLHHAGLLDPLALLGHIQRLEDGLGPLPAVHIRLHEAGRYAHKVNKSPRPVSGLVRRRHTPSPAGYGRVLGDVLGTRPGVV